VKYSTGFAGALVLAVLFTGAARAEPETMDDAGQPGAAPQVMTSSDGLVPPKISVFQFAARKIQKLTAAGDVTGAEALLLQKEEKLSVKPYYTYLLTNTGNAVRKAVQPQLTNALDTLNAVNGRKKFTDNTIEEVTAALNGAAAALKVHASHPLLKRPQFVMPEAAEINAQLALAGGNLKKNAKAYFLAHDHNASNFFQVYPLEQSDDDRKMLVAASDRWITVAMASETPGRILGQYLPWANEKMQAQARSALAAQLIKRNRWRTPLSIAQEFHLAAQMGLELQLPAENVALVNIGAGAPAIDGVDKQQAIESVLELEAALESLREGGVRYVLIRDLGRVLTYEQLKEAGRPETSKRVTGTRRVPNPAYAQAQQELMAAQQAVTAAQQRAATAASSGQMTGGFLSAMGMDENLARGLGAMQGGMAQGQANAAVAAAQQRVQQAQYRLSTTPTEIDEAVETPYQVPTRKVERTKVQELAIYYVDLERRALLQASQRETQRKAGQVMVRFDPADRHQPSLKERNNAVLNDLRMALPGDMVMEEVSARLDDPLQLVSRSTPRGVGGVSAVAALVVDEADAWEKWEQQQVAANHPQLEMEQFYVVEAESRPEERRVAAAAPAPAAMAMPLTGLTDPDSILWAETRATGTIDAYEWYIERFPNGLRVGPARAEIRRLKAAEQENAELAAQRAQEQREERLRQAQEAEQRRKDAAVQAQQRQEEEARAAQQRAEAQRREAAAAAERKKKEDRERREGAATIPSF